MAMLCDVHYHCLLPAEEKVSCSGPCCHCNAEVPIVSHEDEHEEVADDHLDDMQYCLQEVREAQHLLPGEQTDMTIRLGPAEDQKKGGAGAAQPQLDCFTAALAIYGCLCVYLLLPEMKHHRAVRLISTGQIQSYIRRMYPFGRRVIGEIILSYLYPGS
jgi:hypothetical protein